MSSIRNMWAFETTWIFEKKFKGTTIRDIETNGTDVNQNANENPITFHTP